MRAGDASGTYAWFMAGEPLHTNPIDPTCPVCQGSLNGSDSTGRCQSCGAPLGASPDDTAAFQRYYAAGPPPGGGYSSLGGFIRRLLGRS